MTTLTEPQPSSARRPVDHAVFAARKTNRDVITSEPRLAVTADGVWHVHGFEEARAILRSDATRQAGFGAELVAQMPTRMRQPILFLEGETHRELRTRTARFFTPTYTDQHYRALMERLSSELVAELELRGQADLSELSMRLAVAVAAKVVGLTDSRLPGMDRRIGALVESDPSGFGWQPAQLWRFARTQLSLLAFYLLDVRPAIAARRQTPKEDVISHVLGEGYTDPEILSECVTYGAAGMVTTREFICAAAWHLLEHPELRAQYLQAPEAERHALLGEILRLEPVVSTLHRRTTRDLEIESAGRRVRIPAGTRLALHVYAANADERTVGERPHELCPGRSLPRGVQAPVLSFGDGHHRCPGAFIAIQETDIFLTKLLAVPGLRLEGAPSLAWNEVVKGYELRRVHLRAG